MSTAYEFDASRHFASVALDNSLGESKWDAIEKAGNDLKAKIAELDRAIVLMDLSKLEFMGSSVVALIVKIWKDIEGRQGGMVVVSPNEMTMEVLEISGLTRLWPVVKSRDEAEDILSQPPYAAPTSTSTYLRMLLGWIAAAGAVGFVVVLKKELGMFDAQTAQQGTYVCGGLATLIGLTVIAKEREGWRLLGVLLLLVAGGMIAVAAI